MPLPNIAGVVRATFRGTNVAGQQWANVMHFRYAAGASSPGTTEIALLDGKLLRLYTGTAYSGGGAWLNNCTTNVRLLDATYYVLNGTSSPQVISHAQQGIVAAANEQAQEIAMVLTIRTGLRGRRNRGRIYLPAPATTTMTAATGTFSAANVTSTVNQATGLQADLALSQWSWGVASYGVGTLHGQPQYWPAYFTDATIFTMDGVPDVQRRRKQ